MSPQTMRIVLISLAFLTGLVSVFAVILILSGRTPAPVVATASAIGGPFALTDHRGQPITDADLRGKPFLVFFGFTHCPDICPTKLFELSEVLTRLGKDADKVNAIFVTVDPERDTPEKLKLYISSFHPRISALSGSRAQVDAIMKAYSAYAKRTPLEGGGYTMDHTSVVYLMDKEGRFIAPFILERSADAAAADLRRRL